MTAPPTGNSTAPKGFLTAVRAWLDRTFVWHVWERMLEIEFFDRSVALAGKAFVSFFPMVITVAAFSPVNVRTSIIDSLTMQLGLRGEALTMTRDAFGSAEDVQRATGLLGLLLTIFFASSFTTALQRAFFHAWRRPKHGGIGHYYRGVVCLLAALAGIAVLGVVSGALGGGLGTGGIAVVTLAVACGLWWFVAWFMLMGDVRARVLVPTAVFIGVATSAYAGTSFIWMSENVTSNEAQFGVFGVALALIAWFSGAASCVLAGACAGAVLAEDPGRIGAFIRGGQSQTLTAGAAPPLPPPARQPRVRDAFRSTDDT
jgi:membrane protein